MEKTIGRKREMSLTPLVRQANTGEGKNLCTDTGGDPIYFEDKVSGLGITCDADGSAESKGAKLSIPSLLRSTIKKGQKQNASGCVGTDKANEILWRIAA